MSTIKRVNPKEIKVMLNDITLINCEKPENPCYGQVYYNLDNHKIFIYMPDDEWMEIGPASGCQHEWINVSIYDDSSNKAIWVCKHCNIDKEIWDEQQLLNLEEEII